MSAETFSLSNMLPYSSHISPEIIKIKNGSYMIVFRLRGISYVGRDAVEIDNRVNQIKKFIMRLRAPARYNIYIHTHSIRAETTASLEEHFEDGTFVKELNDDYLEKVINSKPIIGNDYYITLIYRAYRTLAGKSIVKTTRKKIQEYQNMAIEELSKVADSVLALFSEYDVKLLTCYERKKNTGHTALYSEPLQFLNRLLNFSNAEVPIMNARISDYLPTSTFSFGSSSMIKIDNHGKTKYAVILSIIDYPDSTYAGVMQSFLELPYQMIVSQIFVPIDKTESSEWLKREYVRMENTDDASSADLEDLINAREDVLADETVIGEYYWSATLFADSPDELREVLSKAIEELSRCQFTVSVNSLAKLQSYLAQLPANLDYRPRQAKLSVDNVAQIMPFHAQNKGKRDGNPWGSAITMFRTANDEIFNFSFHDPQQNNDERGELAPANTVISGMTGSGKTVLLSFLLAQSQRLERPPRIIVFDYTLGSSVFVKAMGGAYSQVKVGEPTGFNPFRLENTASTRAFLKQLIVTILRDGGMPTARELNEIDDAIAHIMSYPDDSPFRDIEGLANYLSDAEDNSIKQRLKPWTTGEHAWIFNNKVDNFNLSSHVIGIDYTEFLDIAEIRTPILMYLLYRVEIMLDGYPTIISMDEAWKALKDVDMQDYIEKKQRTIRKENGVLILTTQSPSDFYQNVSPAIMEQVVTQIFLPNPRAKREAYIDKVGISEDEFKRVVDMSKTSREFLVKYQQETVHCKLSLAGIRSVDVLSGSEFRAKLADKLIQQHNDDWLEKYYIAIESEKHKENINEN